MKMWKIYFKKILMRQGLKKKIKILEKLQFATNMSAFRKLFR